MIIIIIIIIKNVFKFFHFIIVEKLTKTSHMSPDRTVFVLESAFMIPFTLPIFHV